MALKPIGESDSGQPAEATPANRPLFIDFDLYTEGDFEYKKELGALLIGNVKELRHALPQAVRCHDAASFDRTCHKIKVTLSMLQDPELNQIVEELRGEASNPVKDKAYVSRADRFQEVCDMIVMSLTREISGA